MVQNTYLPISPSRQTTDSELAIYNGTVCSRDNNRYEEEHRESEPMTTFTLHNKLILFCCYMATCLL